MTHEETRLHAAVLAAFERHTGDPRIGAAVLAMEAMHTLDPKRTSLPEVYAGCNMYCRQIARQLLRGKYDATALDDDDPQIEMFPDLQERYPARHERGEEPIYVLRELLTQDDWLWNKARMQKHIRARQRAYNAFDAWGRAKFDAAADAA